MRLLTSLFVLFVFALPAQADIASMRARIPKLVLLKDKGLVGEKKDGLLGVVKDEAGARQVVAAENKDRLGIYKKRAAKGGHKLPVFMKVMGEERIKKEKKGRFIQDASGKWIKK